LALDGDGFTIIANLSLTMLLALFNIALSIAFIVGIVWALNTLGELRRGQRQLSQDLAHLAEALRIPLRSDEPIVTCPRCGAHYAADLTGCNVCGRAKPKDAVAFVPSSAEHTTREPRE
jgi:hypothetical protein